MAIFSGDAVIKKSLELMIKEIRGEPYLIPYILGDFEDNPYLRSQGKSQIDSCKEWILNNDIHISLHGIQDKDRFPSISIFMAPSPEKSDMKHLSDESTEVVKLLPKEIGKPIPYIVNPFTPASYSQLTGILVVPSTVAANNVTVNQVVVNPDNGQGYPIIGVKGQSIFVRPGTYIKASKLAILPQYPYYMARQRHIFTQDTYVLTCRANDAQSLMWLWQIALYALLRYKETLLEAVGFTESVMNSGDVSPDEFFTTPGGESVFQRQITITGQVEQTFLVSPRRKIESANIRGKDHKAKSPDNPEGYVGGIQIASNVATPLQDRDQTNWYTVDDELNDEYEDD